MRVVGIDTGVTSKHCAVVVDSEGTKDSKPILFGTSIQEYDRMIEEANKGGKTDIFAIETAGEAWYTLALHLHKKGYQVAIVSPEKSHDFRKSLRKYTKTNRIDASSIARSLIIDRTSITYFSPRTTKIEALRRLTRRYTSLQKEQAAHRTIIRAELRSLLPSWRQPEGIFTMPYKKWFKKGVDPWYWNETNKAELQELLKDPVETERIIEACEQTRKIYSNIHQEGLDSGVLAVQQEVAILELLEDQIKELKRKISQIYRELDEDRVLTSICGIGEFTAAVILGEVGDITRFRNSAGFSSYCGVVPKRNDTGDTHRQGQKMTKQGNRHLRRVLFLAALSGTRTDPELATIYYRQKEVLKKHHNKAMGFVMNALARRIYAVLKRNPHLFSGGKGEKAPYIIKIEGITVDKKVAREWIEKNKKTTSKKNGSRAGKYPPETVKDVSRISNGLPLIV